jgi:hypothetical protein
LDLLARETEMLGAGLVVLQVDVRDGEIRRDGMLAARAKVGFPGVRVSFDSRHAARGVLDSAAALTNGRDGVELLAATEPAGSLAPEVGAATNVGLRYLVVATRIVGNPADWSHSYSSDLELFDDRQAAIDHGIEDLGHDDFNIATIRGGRIVAFGFDMEDFAAGDCDDLTEIERQLCLPDALRREAVSGG